jgi:DNA polymerase-3 subunit epsilon
MTWHRGPLFGFDLESTGVDVASDRIVTAAIVDIRPGETTRTRTWIVNPGIDIPEGATAVHGISTEKARAEGQHPSVALEEIALELTVALASGTPIVAFNGSFDLSMTDQELLRYKLGGFEERLGSYDAVSPVLDPHVLDKRLDKYRKGSRTLTATCEAYGVALDNAHAADADAIAACRLLFKLASKFNLPGEYTLHGLHDAQVAWRADQMASLADYFRRQGKDVSDIDPAWPLRRLAVDRAA